MTVHLSRRGIRTVLALEAVAFGLLATLMLDVGAHRRDDPHVINQFGYRGPARASKRSGELRVVIVGGSAAFGAGTPWPSTLGPELVSAMNKTKGLPDAAPFADVQNLSEPLAGADSYVPVLESYDYLEPDLIAVYDGYDPVGGELRGRRRSMSFRSTGYLPILFGPGRRLADAEPGIASALTDAVTRGGDPSCEGLFSRYCAAMVGTVRFALAERRSVIVATPPYVTDRHRMQQVSLASELARLFNGEARFRYIDLGRTVDLHDSAQSPDGVHTTASANRIIAGALAGPVVSLLEHEHEHE
jgi:hypothetical protein